MPFLTAYTLAIIQHWYNRASRQRRAPFHNAASVPKARSEDANMKIAVVGSGYVGLVAGACLAELGHEVVLVDDDKRKISALQRAECPIHEKFLPELLQRHHNRFLRFTGNLTEAVESSQVVFIAVGTPPMEDGRADLFYVESVAQGIAPAIRDYKAVVVKCTVPVYTADW